MAGRMGGGIGIGLKRGTALPDILAPTITSVAAVPALENFVLAHALTASEIVSWSIVGGADQARFEISGTTLRWASNGTKNYESPDDANTDNAYVVTVRATDLVGNSANQTITVTVIDVFEMTDLGASLLELWDAEDVSTLTLAGALVSTWTGKIIGVAPTQSFGSQKPVYSATSFNGRPSVTFDGTDDMLSVDTQPFPSGANTCEVWTLGENLAAISSIPFGVAFSYGGVTTGTYRQIGRLGDGAHRQGAGQSSNNMTLVNVIDTVHPADGVAVVRVRHEATRMRLSVNGNAFVDSATTAPITGATRSRIGARLSNTPSQYINGRINMVGVTTLLSDPQAALLTTLLKTRGGVP